MFIEMPRDGGLHESHPSRVYMEQTGADFLNYKESEEAEVLDLCKAQLDSEGWSVVKNVIESRVSERFFQQLGPFLPQYDGNLRYVVKALPGYEKYQYSQSANSIQPHTEAPGYTPPPRYLAFHCHQQATCGGGHILLADGYDFIASLDTDLHLLACTKPIHFQTTSSPTGEHRKGIEEPIYGIDTASGVKVVRYSYNVMRYNHLHPEIIDEEDEANGLNRDPFFEEMCNRGIRFFVDTHIRVLTPSNSLLIFDNWRMLHARHAYSDKARHLMRYWIGITRGCNQLQDQHDAA
jgi:hypothetical protein